MISHHRLIANHSNLVRAATIEASAQRPAGAPRLHSQQRTGRGGMTVTGDYSGAADGQIEVEVTSGSGSQLRPSAPLIAGVGNGIVTVTAVDTAAVPEIVTFRLAASGDPPQRAELAFYGVTLLARAAGAGGNDLTLTVTRNLTLSKTLGATLDDLPLGTGVLPDARWDFGAATATGAGIPLDAPRVSFVGYPGIHRHWRAWLDGGWVYQIDPPLPYAVSANTAIQHVTGDYELVLTDGVTTETYRAVTVFELLSALRDRSLLVEAVGTVAKDTAPGGMAVSDIPLRTDAYALPPIASVRGPDGRTYLDNVVVAPTALTENLRITCRASTGAAPARWLVEGGASGTLPDATTGVRYPGGPVAFTVPAGPLPQLVAPITTKVTLQNRGAGEARPSLCIEARPGIRATAKRITFTYAARPHAGCDCTTLTMPRPNAAWLGIDDGGNGMAIDPDYLSRLQALYDWRSAFQDTQSSLYEPADARWATQDMDLCDAVVGTFAATLEQIYSEPDARAGWDAELTRLQDEFNPMSGLGRVAPAAIAVGMAVGALGWHPLTQRVYQLSRVQAITPAVIAVGMTVGATALNPANAHLYRLDSLEEWRVFTDCPESKKDNLTVLQTMPSPVGWNTSGHTSSTVTSVYDSWINAECGARYYENRAVWSDLGHVDDEATIHAALVPQSDMGALTVQPNLTAAWQTTESASFTLSAAYAGLAEGTERSTWICRGLPQDLNASAAVDQLARRYTARMDSVLTLAGLVPKSNASSGSGDGCWRDLGDPFYWEDESGVYLPAFNNSAYVSCATGDGILARLGASYSTQEFGFGLAVDCVEALRVGDQFAVILNGATDGPYAEGDTFTIPVIGAAPARFAGGAGGNTEHAWAVSGSAGGAYPDWIWDPLAPTPYTAGPLDVAMEPGGIPFEVGDLIRLALEGGTMRWRRNGGEWTAGDLYDPRGHDLSDGLTLHAVAGSVPSFLAGDTWTFDAVATYGPDRLRQPREGSVFAWDGPTLDLTLDLGAVQSIDALLLALHTLPSTAAVSVAGGHLHNGTDPRDWLIDVPCRAGPLFASPPAGASARYLAISIRGAGAGAEIGWLWAGVPWAPACPVSAMQHVRQYGLTHSNSRNPTARYSGRGTGGRWAWDLSAGSGLLPGDVAALTTILDHVAENGLEWVCLVPDVAAPAGATLAQIDADAVTFTEELGYQLDAQALMSVELPFRAVLR